MENLRAEIMFYDYKMLMKAAVSDYNVQITVARYSSLGLAKHIWRMGMLSEIWGTMATRLSGTGRNFLQEWREGK